MFSPYVCQKRSPTFSVGTQVPSSDLPAAILSGTHAAYRVTESSSLPVLSPSIGWSRYSRGLEFLSIFAEGHPIRIAVLDDDPALVRLVQKLLHYSLGDAVQVDTFNAPSQFENWLDSHCCDLLLSDIEMPETDGLAILRAVKQRNSWTQVVMLTGASTSERLVEALELGASDYLVKPVQTASLNEVVTQSVQRIRRWRRAFVATHASC